MDDAHDPHFGAGNPVDDVVGIATQDQFPGAAGFHDLAHHGVLGEPLGLLNDEIHYRFGSGWVISGDVEIDLQQVASGARRPFKPLSCASRHVESAVLRVPHAAVRWS